MEAMKDVRKAIITAIMMLIIFQPAFASFRALDYNFCPRDSLPYRDECFSFVYPEEHTAKDASFLCHFIYGRESGLASVSSGDKLEFLNMNAFRALIAKDFPESKFWVAGQQPWVHRNSDIPGGCYIYTGDRVENEDCDAKHGFICSIHKEQYNPRDKCLEGVTWDSFIGEITGNCVFRTPDATTKENAVEKCAEYGGQFLDLHEILVDGQTLFRSQAQNRRWEQLFVNDLTRYWTNLKTDGTDVVLSSREPLRGKSIIFNPERGECVTVGFNLKDDLEIQLYQMECKNQAYVMCSMPANTSQAMNLGTFKKL